MKKTLFIPLLAQGILLSLMPIAASAATDITASGNSTQIPTFQPLTNVDGTPFAAMFGANATLTGFFQGLFNVSITIGALLAVLMLAWGGYEFLFSDIVDKRGKAKTRIQNALLGLLMLLATVLILRQINPDIVSLRILSNQGANVTSSQTTGPSSANGFTDSGTQMTTPQGYCVDQGPVNVALSSANYYQCYNTLAACGQIHGINNCAAYSTSQDSTYSSGTGNGLASPASATDYMSYHWCPAGTSDSTCPAGTGWVAVSADYCGAGASAGNGTCYALQKPVSYANVAAISNGNWCYYSTISGTTSSYDCAQSQTACATTQANADTNAAVGLCVQKTASSTADSFLVPVTTSQKTSASPTAQKGEICGLDSLAATGALADPSHQYVCGYSSIAACQAGVNGKLTGCQLY